MRLQRRRMHPGRAHIEESDFPWRWFCRWCLSNFSVWFPLFINLFLIKHWVHNSHAFNVAAGFKWVIVHIARDWNPVSLTWITATSTAVPMALTVRPFPESAVAWTTNHDFHTGTSSTCPGAFTNPTNGDIESCEANNVRENMMWWPFWVANAIP